MNISTAVNECIHLCIWPLLLLMTHVPHFGTHQSSLPKAASRSHLAEHAVIAILDNGRALLDDVELVTRGALEEDRLALRKLDLREERHIINQITSQVRSFK